MNAQTTGRTVRAALALGLLVLAGTMALTLPSAAQAQDSAAHLRAFIDRLNEGMAKGDFDHAVSLQAEDGVRVHPHAGVIKGRKGLRDYFAGLSKSYSAKETITWVVGNGTQAAAAITWDATELKTGKHIKMPMALLVEFDSAGMIKWSQIYFDYALAYKDAK